MVTVAIRALELEYLDKILDWGWSQSRHILPTPTLPKIPSDSNSTTPTPTPQPCLQMWE
jgi:hypothetical protein